MPKKAKHPTPPQKKPLVIKAVTDASEADDFPADWDQWTQAQKQAYWDALDDDSLNYTPTAEELAMAERFMRKMESAQVGPAQPQR